MTPAIIPSPSIWLEVLCSKPLLGKTVKLLNTLNDLIDFSQIRVKGKKPSKFNYNSIFSIKDGAVDLNPTSLSSAVWATLLPLHFGLKVSAGSTSPMVEKIFYFSVHEKIP